MNKSLRNIQEYYSKNSDRIKKRIKSDGIYDEDSWLSRASSRYVENLDIYVRNELESLDLWDDEVRQEDGPYSTDIDMNVCDGGEIKGRLISYINSEPSYEQCLPSMKVDYYMKLRIQVVNLFPIKQSTGISEQEVVFP